MITPPERSSAAAWRSSPAPLPSPASIIAEPGISPLSVDDEVDVVEMAPELENS